MAFKMRGNPMQRNFGIGSPAKKYVSDAQRKAVHASKAEKSAAKFNEGLRKASAEGKLDNNPKFKAAVDKSPVQLKKSAGKYGKKHDKLRAKGHQARAAADEAFDAGKKKKTDRLDRRAEKKLGKARDIRVKQFEQARVEKNPFKLKKETAEEKKQKHVKSKSYVQRVKDEASQIYAGLKNMPASHKSGGMRGKKTYNPIDRFKKGYAKEERKTSRAAEKEGASPTKKRKGVRKGKTTDYRTKSTKIEHSREAKLGDKKLNKLNKRLSAKMSRQGTKVAERSTIKKKADKQFKKAYSTARPADRKAYDEATKRAQDALRKRKEAREASNREARNK